MSRVADLSLRLSNSTPPPIFSGSIGLATGQTMQNLTQKAKDADSQEETSGTISVSQTRDGMGALVSVGLIVFVWWNVISF